MDGETIEKTVREAIASVNDNAASVDRLSSELDEHARCAYRLDQCRPRPEVGRAAPWLHVKWTPNSSSSSVPAVGGIAASSSQEAPHQTWDWLGHKYAQISMRTHRPTNHTASFEA